MKPWYHSTWDQDHIHVLYELEHEKDTIKPGMAIRFKNVRGLFKFGKLVHNSRLDVTWIDCLDANGQYRSFYVDRLKGPVKTKKSRRKRK